ncbi:MAG: TIM-barrel domain-containing protein [Janthinobacterium lividum]
MPRSFIRRAGWLLPTVLLLTSPTRAQQVGGRPPTQDPFGQPARLAPEVPGGRYKSHTLRGQTLTIYATDGSSRQVHPWARGVIKISYFAPGRPPIPDSSLSVVQSPAKLEFSRLRNDSELKSSYPDSKKLPVFSTPTTLRIETAWDAGWATKSEILIDKASLRISVGRHDDILFSEASPAFRRQPTAFPPTDDTPPSRADELAGTGVCFRLAPGEQLYGTGARALPLDRRGYRLELYNQAHYGYQNGEQNLNVALPVVLSSRGYLLLFDHYAAGYLDLGKQQTDVLEYGAQGLTSLSYFVVTGNSQAEILDRYTALTGRQPLPPRWALGLIQSRFGYRSQAEMLAVARRMRRENFPLDALVLDLFWFGGTTRQGDFAWDAAHFPDPAGMMRDLKAQGVKTVLISEPYVMRTSLNDSLVRTQELVGTTAAGRPFTVGSFWAGPASILDVFKPAARTWLWAQYQRLHDQGAAGWWSDLGEPENHPLAMHHRLGPAAQVHNAYGMTWAQIFQDNYAKEYPNERLFNLARSGWAGMQRNAVFPWSGDINRSWSGLQAQVPIMLGMGQAGVGYMHSDAGGFGANATQDPELYTRWLQLAALCPIMRPHSDQVVAPEPYTYPEPYKSIVRHYAHLRMELLPYLYTLAAQNTLTGAPLARAIDYTEAISLGEQHQAADATDQRARTVAVRLGAMTPPTSSSAVAEVLANSQYLLGPNLLVAPVNQPGQRRRNVALPATPGGWVDFETGQTLPSGQTVGLNAPLGHIPLLARAGAFVPMTAYRPSTAAYRPDTLAVRYFPDPKVPASAFTMYEDNGHSAQALKQLEFALVEFTGTTTADFTTFTAVISGNYSEAPAQRLVQLRIARVATAPTAVRLEGEPLAADKWQYDAGHHELRVQFLLVHKASLTLTGLRLLTQPAAQTDPETLTLTAPDSRSFSGSVGLHYERYVAAPAPAPLRIRNARGQVVRELPTTAAAGLQSITWDGLDAQGRPAAAGLYEVELAGQHQRLVRLPQ